MEAVKTSGIKFGYAENWVYAPSFVKLWRLAEVGEGNHPAHRGGGVALRLARRLRQAVAALRRRLADGEGLAPAGRGARAEGAGGPAKFGKPIRAASVICETGNLTWIDSFEKEETKYLRTGWKDVEDWGIIVVKFEDGSVAEVKAARHHPRRRAQLPRGLSLQRPPARQHQPDRCLSSPTRRRRRSSEPEYIVEKIETKAGWTQPSPDEDWMQGYPQEIADYVNSIREDRSPSPAHGLAREVMIVLYAAYVERRRRRRRRAVEVAFSTQSLGGSPSMAKVRVGLVGHGFAAGLHMPGYRAARPGSLRGGGGVRPRPGRAPASLRREHGIPHAFGSLTEMLRPSDFDAVDLAVPEPRAHPVRAGGGAGRQAPHRARSPSRATSASPIPRPMSWSASTVPKQHMLDRVIEECDAILRGHATGRREVLLCRELVLRARRSRSCAAWPTPPAGTILRIEAEESHSGSTSSLRAPLAHRRRGLAEC